MKTRPLLAGLALACAAALPLPALAQAAPLQGEVLEVLNVDSYTYLRLKTRGGEMWAAVTTAAVKKGAQVSIANPMPMENFESKSLKRKFDRIVFGHLAAPGAAPAGPAAAGTPPGGRAAGPGSMLDTMPGNRATNPHGAKPAAAPAVAATPVPKASGPDARTVAEVVTGKGQLKDKTVVIRARVVKVNSGIMGKNWLHLQDGSGQAGVGTNDLLVTSKDLAAVGDIVTARGVVRTDVTLGAGYAYAVMMEDAALKK